MLPAALIAHLDRAMARLRAAGIAFDADDAALRLLLLASDFAVDTLVRQPALFATLDDPAQPPPALTPDNEADWPRLLRRWRAAESTRLVWRDVRGLDGPEQTIAGSTRIAEQALQAGLVALEATFAQRHGVLRDASGAPVRLTVFGLGKLGGGELNFSSDVDLVYAFSEHGSSDGERPLDAEGYCTRLGQRLAQLLGEVTADGFVHRVDLRLRPFGASGRVALSFAAMEQYFQREGRDWERYAWIKARPVAGDIAAGERLLEALRPFVYRRYLDYTALDGLRAMKALIDAEVGRRELAQDLKLGPGGIREIEFLVQALQLIRGGREPALRQRSLMPSLVALAAAGHLPAQQATALAEAYRFLRRLENRVQMFTDAQAHSLPDDAVARERIALGLEYADVDTMIVELDAHRALVQDAFAGLLRARHRPPELGTLARYWQALPEGGDAAVLAEVGFTQAEDHHARLRDFARSPAVRTLSEAARVRLDHVLPALLEAAANSAAPDAALPRGLGLLQSISRRASYLALLDEQPEALRRLVDVVARSALLAERLAAHPLLLDELLDTRAAQAPPTGAALAALVKRELTGRAASAEEGDTEAALARLGEVRQSLSFRIALATLAQRQPAGESAAQLAELAEQLLAHVLALARTGIEAAHGIVPGAGFAVLGYGSLGGRELGFGSDLDIVFLHDAPADAVSDGARPLDASRYFARLAQKLVGLLGATTAAGRLYEADVRLRPDGAKGLLVSSVDGFADYQHQRAWTWEQQALLRARAVAGDAGPRERFAAIRAEVLRRPREPDAVRSDVRAMRARMRAELDRSDAAHFDLKQGEGGLVDLEFALQALVLANASAHPELDWPTDTPALINALAAVGALPAADASTLRAAHETLLARSLDCTLDQRPRLCRVDEGLA
ncbi:MAG: bifunctional [glutamate--ammonia ligase]-adenylyl-L-tyrosine phosphorylase/[glutamate--ammonia-ligase] adenylyltransferase, partial [Arenimonas sp.]